MMLAQVIRKVKIHILAWETFAAAGFGQFLSPRRVSKNHWSIESEGRKAEDLMGAALRILAVDM
ncbi:MULTISPECIES: hypothetical protein [Paenibacillus]|uniref:hypothetical protein n=1 Tax=Paenibacillus TaxID=44249 RepID=UPI000F9AAEE4|nr:hypothetical protein [Paenibacillus xylanexedens]RPK16808.1 hypothetical protein EDO6_02918 [Paenibacillus xylanexedens]